MKTSVWIKVAGKKSYGTWKAGQVTASKSKPSTRANELAIKIDLTIPDSYFELPELRAIVTLPASTSKEVIQTSIQKNIENELTKQLGVKVHITSESGVIQ